MIFSRLPSLVAKVVGSPPHLGISHIQVVANNIWWAKQYHCMDITIRWTCSFLSNHFTDLDANPLKDQNKKSKTKHNKKQIHTIHCRLKRKYNIKKSDKSIILTCEVRINFQQLAVRRWICFWLPVAHPLRRWGHAPGSAWNPDVSTIFFIHETTIPCFCSGAFWSRFWTLWEIFATLYKSHRLPNPVI